MWWATVHHCQSGSALMPSTAKIASKKHVSVHFRKYQWVKLAKYYLNPQLYNIVFVLGQEEEYTV